MLLELYVAENHAPIHLDNNYIIQGRLLSRTLLLTAAPCTHTVNIGLHNCYSYNSLYAQRTGAMGVKFRLACKGTTAALTRHHWASNLSGTLCLASCLARDAPTNGLFLLYVLSITRKSFLWFAFLHGGGNYSHVTRNHQVG